MTLFATVPPRNVTATTRNGFSLVELSVVLVILAVITGGVLAGRSLVQASELRSVASEYESFQRASFAFTSQYNALAGDYRDATDMWGRIGTVCNDSSTGSGGEACDGDGNGTIEGQASAGDSHAEGYMFWKHLSLAGLINGKYTGLSGPGDGDHDQVGVNVPVSAFKRGGWNIDNNTSTTGTARDFALDYGRHYLEFGGTNGAADDTDEPILTPAEAKQLDDKIDDGFPAHGNVVARFWNDGCTFTTGAYANTNYDMTYNIDDIEQRCALIFRGGL